MFKTVNIDVPKLSYEHPVDKEFQLVNANVGFMKTEHDMAQTNIGNYGTARNLFGGLMSSIQPGDLERPEVKAAVTAMQEKIDHATNLVQSNPAYVTGTLNQLGMDLQTEALNGVLGKLSGFQKAYDTAKANSKDPELFDRVNLPKVQTVKDDLIAGRTNLSGAVSNIIGKVPDPFDVQNLVYSTLKDNMSQSVTKRLYSIEGGRIGEATINQAVVNQTADEMVRIVMNNPDARRSFELYGELNPVVISSNKGITTYATSTGGTTTDPKKAMSIAEQKIRKFHGDASAVLQGKRIVGTEEIPPRSRRGDDMGTTSGTNEPSQKVYTQSNISGNSLQQFVNVKGEAVKFFNFDEFNSAINNMGYTTPDGTRMTPDELTKKLKVLNKGRAEGTVDMNTYNQWMRAATLANEDSAYQKKIRDTIINDALRGVKDPKLKKEYQKKLLNRFSGSLRQPHVDAYGNPRLESHKEDDYVPANILTKLNSAFAQYYGTLAGTAKTTGVPFYSIPNDDKTTGVLLKNAVQGNGQVTIERIDDSGKSTGLEKVNGLNPDKLTLIGIGLRTPGQGAIVQMLDEKKNRINVHLSPTMTDALYRNFQTNPAVSSQLRDGVISITDANTAYLNDKIQRTHANKTNTNTDASTDNVFTFNGKRVTIRKTKSGDLYYHVQGDSHFTKADSNQSAVQGLLQHLDPYNVTVRKETNLPALEQLLQ